VPVQPAVVVVQTDVDSAKFMLDGRVVADGAPTARIAVPRPGEHEITVTAARRKPYVRKLSVEAGATVELTARLEKSYSGKSAKPKRGENYLVNPFGK
jgi:hypothetical protein